MTKLSKAFRNLRKAGYFARQNWKCCQSCGCAAVPDEYEDRYVFYHAQDNDDLKRSGSCYLAWAGDGKEICRILQEVGITTKWNGHKSKRIFITGGKQ